MLEPSTVGSKRFQFLVGFRDGAYPECVTNDAWIDGVFQLLSAVPELQDDWAQTRPGMHSF